jgi:hypothetical protein
MLTDAGKVGFYSHFGTTQATQFYEGIELCQAVNMWCFVEPISSLK